MGSVAPTALYLFSAARALTRPGEYLRRFRCWFSASTSIAPLADRAPTQAKAGRSEQRPYEKLQSARYGKR